MCGGTGKKAVEPTEDIELRCIFNPLMNTADRYAVKNPDLISPINIRLPNSLLKTRGFITDVPKILRATSLIVSLPSEGYIRARYTRVTEPQDRNTFVPNRYFTCFWQRAG
jgi:hypothetical protein